MNKVLFLFLRRMRTPLLVLIGAYTLAGLGLLLIPGVDEHGETWRMDILHVLYFLSYTATTTGFGEVPRDFSEAQRLWVMFSIYLTIIAWLYAIGKILALVQEPAFRQAVRYQGFERHVRRMQEPFYIVCGYGDTGSMLVKALVHRGQRAVVIDLNLDRINDLELTDLSSHVPAMVGDASVSRHLRTAGLRHPLCQGVLAVTDNDDANLKIAITVKLLNPTLPVVCRAHTRATRDNMASFGTDHIVNPFDAFGERLTLALQSPGLYLLREWLTSVPDTPLQRPVEPPRGTWILVGFGRLGGAVKQGMKSLGMGTVVIEELAERADPDGPSLHGRGTEADTLQQAGVANAVGLLAGTDEDTNNLSCLMTARALNPDLFIVARQNHYDNRDIFRAAKPDLIMRPSEMIAEAILAHLSAPLLARFLELSREKDDDWANELLSRITGVTDEVVPEVWLVNVNDKSAPALVRLLQEQSVTLGALLDATHAWRDSFNCVPLMRVREGEALLTPGPETDIQTGDRLLLCGQPRVADRFHHLLRDVQALRYLVTGYNRPDGWVWRAGSGRGRPGTTGNTN
ncbi:potassium transporter TrkA [Ectothiorhodospira haloalkaliphila]|uniref:Potassium transporter TrkA n=1 Tax=Ectothiorhodospira haloalkaliphila TaxID=421628 RepID=W8L7P1_9GAMM|nr:potassium channel protein [Ectothiorhodospira haloalkaliphila]AHK79865.1 potassium transporter TrkA [Ectothiorhodospira haloalkaliphila]MCG5524170.1 NAD-binding protein [Ectothiorhodospira haloalkaliphila]